MSHREDDLQDNFGLANEDEVVIAMKPGKSFPSMILHSNVLRLPQEAKQTEPRHLNTLTSSAPEEVPDAVRRVRSPPHHKDKKETQANVRDRRRLDGSEAHSLEPESAKLDPPDAEPRPTELRSSMAWRQHDLRPPRLLPKPNASKANQRGGGGGSAGERRSSMENVKMSPIRYPLHSVSGSLTERQEGGPDVSTTLNPPRSVDKETVQRTCFLCCPDEACIHSERSIIEFLRMQKKCREYELQVAVLSEELQRLKEHRKSSTHRNTDGTPVTAEVKDACTSPIFPPQRSHRFPSESIGKEYIIQIDEEEEEESNGEEDVRPMELRTTRTAPALQRMEARISAESVTAADDDMGLRVAALFPSSEDASTVSLNANASRKEPREDPHSSRLLETDSSPLPHCHADQAWRQEGKADTSLITHSRHTSSSSPTSSSSSSTFSVSALLEALKEERLSHSKTREELYNVRERMHYLQQHVRLLSERCDSLTSKAAEEEQEEGEGEGDEGGIRQRRIPLPPSCRETSTATGNTSSSSSSSSPPPVVDQEQKGRPEAIRTTTTSSLTPRAAHSDAIHGDPDPSSSRRSTPSQATQEAVRASENPSDVVSISTGLGPRGKHVISSVGVSLSRSSSATGKDQGNTPTNELTHSSGLPLPHHSSIPREEECSQVRVHRTTDDCPVSSSSHFVSPAAPCGMEGEATDRLHSESISRVSVRMTDGEVGATECLRCVELLRALLDKEQQLVSIALERRKWQLKAEEQMKKMREKDS